MRFISRLIFTCTIILTLFSMSHSAFATLFVSPQSIDLGTARVLPGSSMGPFTFSMSVGSDMAVEGTTYTAASNAGWLALEPASGEIPGVITVTATVSESMDTGTWVGIITVNSSVDSGAVEIPVQVTVIRSIGDLLTASPTSIALSVTQQNVSEQSIPITIANADPNKTSFTWSAVPDVGWLELSKNTGDGNETITMTLDQSELVLTEDADGDGHMDGATGTIIIRSSLHEDPVTVTVNLTMHLPDDDQVQFSVSPNEVYWSIERGTDTTVELSFNPQSIYAWGQEGWTVSYDSAFFTVTAFGSGGSEVNGLRCEDDYGHVEVTPVADIVQNLPYGTHTGYVTITDFYNLHQQKVLVTLNIRRPGEQVVLPTVSQVAPNYSTIDATDASVINLRIPTGEDSGYYGTFSDCQAANGVWINPDMVSGNLDEYCSLNQHLYVLIQRPDMESGIVYIMNQAGMMGLAYYNGVLAPGAEAYAYSTGPVSEVPLGPMQLLGCYGRYIVSIRKGSQLSSATELQRVQINLKTPAGSWIVTESYLGQTYTYNNGMYLSLNPDPSGYGYTGAWGWTPISMTPRDGVSSLYQYMFTESGITFVYEVQQLSANYMAGRWHFLWPGGESAWEPFSAQRIIWAP